MVKVSRKNITRQQKVSKKNSRNNSTNNSRKNSGQKSRKNSRKKINRIMKGGGPHIEHDYEITGYQSTKLVTQVDIQVKNGYRNRCIYHLYTNGNNMDYTIYKDVNGQFYLLLLVKKGINPDNTDATINSYKLNGDSNTIFQYKDSNIITKYVNAGTQTLKLNVKEINGDYIIEGWNQSGDATERMLRKFIPIPEELLKGPLEPQDKINYFFFGPFYKEIDKKKEDIKTENKYGLEDSELAEYAEFSAIPIRNVVTSENNPLNRYANILPYSEISGSQIKLGPSNDGYINANYIPFFQSCRKEYNETCSYTGGYIATQGPIPDTFEHFWTMIIEKKVSIIVMVTGLVEKKRLKCHRYWPGEQSPEEQRPTEDFGSITVTITKVSDQGGYTVTTLEIKRDGNTQTVTHFWFQGWPDQDVPTNYDSFNKFHKAVHQFRESQDQPFKCYPIVVHCSAGIGRTGVFIAIDQVLRSNNKVIYMDKQGNFSVNKDKDKKYEIHVGSLFTEEHATYIVNEMRKYRPQLVQTQEQLQFIKTGIREGIIEENVSDVYAKKYLPKKYVTARKTYAESEAIKQLPDTLPTPQEFIERFLKLYANKK